MLHRIGCLRVACDLDLLLFFYRHPRALLTGEQLVTYLGYGREQLVKSLEMLIEAGFVTRSQNPSHTTRLYVLDLDALPDGLLSRLLKIADTRQGRQAVMDLLRPGPDHTPAINSRRRTSFLKVA